MSTNNELPSTVIFPKGNKIENEFFTGTAWLEMLVEKDNTFHCPVCNVSFEQGARNNWHRHPGGQILLVTGGQGWYQEEGKPARPIKAGDVVKIPPEIKHWHGAAPDSPLTHIAIETNTHAGAVEWLEPVGDEAYGKL